MSANTGKRYHQTYGDDFRVDEAIGRQLTKHVNGTGSDFVDGVLSGFAWRGSSISYAFPDSKSDYRYKNEPSHGFGEVSAKIRAAAEFTLDKDYGGKANDGFSVEGFTDLHILGGSDSTATIRYAESSYKNPTAYGYFPNRSDSGGDIWFGPSYKHYSNAVSGNYEYATVIHETGHALGLKHGHEAGFGNPAIPDRWDSLEYSVMTYKSYVGGPNGPYDNEKFGFPQTFMMADIAALQHMYGANFNVNDGSTTYSWKPNSGNTYVNGNVGIHPGGNTILATIWDGGGQHDTYDLSAYRTNISVDLRPGAYSTFRDTQLADLDASSRNKQHIADGNIYNALQYKGDDRSLIEDAIGGSGNDVLTGNAVGNRLEGNGGNDTFYGEGGNDHYAGGTGDDTFFFRKGWDKDTIEDFRGGDRINLSQFNFANLDEVLATAVDDGKNVTLVFGNGDGVTIENMNRADLHANDFIL